MAPDGSVVNLTTERGGTATFNLGEGFDETYMLLGASQGCGDSRGACGSLSVLPLGVATGLARRYPDFRRCASPGAREAKANLTSLQLLVPDRRTPRVLQAIAQDSERRVRESGEWMCVSLSGSYAEFVQVDVGGAVLTASMVPTPPAGAIKQYFVLPKSLTPMECPPLT